MNVCCPHCKNAIEIIAEDASESVVCPGCKSKVSLLEFLSVNPSIEQTNTYSAEHFVPQLGTSVAHFRLDDKLGRGGFGTVFKAFDKRLERHVALKIPRTERMSRWQAENFIHEAQSAAQRQDPNIGSVYEVGRDEERIFIVSELIEGKTLDVWRKEQKPTQLEIASMMAKIANALHRAHQKKIIHRDLKPKNVIVDEVDSPHVTDFGLAKRESPEEMTITTKGVIIGTPAYMSPEQAMGKANEADCRTDVYSMGVMLYEFLTERRPYRGESDILTEEIIRGDVIEPHVFNKTVDPDLEAICLKAMARKPGDRFDSALELAEDLNRFANREPTLTRPLTKMQKGVRLARRHWMKAALAAVVLASISFGLVSVLNRGTAQTVGEVGPVEYQIEFRVVPPESDVSIVKVDYSLGKVDYQSLHQPAKVAASPDSRTDKLTPGWYIIEVVAPSGDIQEVWRYVPRELNESSNPSCACTDWTETADGGVRWQAIKVKPIDASLEQKLKLGKEKVVEVAGSKFTVGAYNLFNLDMTKVRPEEEVEIYDFYAGVSEVTTKSYKEVMRKLPLEMTRRFRKEAPADEMPIGNVPFVEALEYCERIGARLPVFEEYLYLATNGGEFAFPTGNDWTLGSWPLGLDAGEVVDTNKFGIRNLYSSQLEWTQDYAVPINSASDSPDWGDETNPLVAGLQHSRLAVGGPMEGLEGSVEKLDEVDGPRRAWVMKLGISTQFEGLGFRVYRSKTPRLTPDNPVIKYLESIKAINDRSKVANTQ
jgi:serine/threonine-protein kinase